MPDLAVFAAQHERTRTSETALSRVLRQLLEALLFEGCIDSIHVQDKASGAHTFYFAAGHRHYACKGRLRGFGRVRLDIKTLVRLEAGTRRPPTGIEMLHEIVDALTGDRQAKNQLTGELLQSVYWTQWNQENLPRLSRRQMEFAALETHLWEGHPYHPCFKARSGFSDSDYRQYSSECGQQFQLRWIGVHRRHVFNHLPMASVDFYRLQGCAGLLTVCRQFGCDPEEYLWVPVHPWQWRHYLAGKIASVAIDGKPAILDMGLQGDFYRASQSQRTLMNISRPGAPDIKLPLNIVCTSSRRHLQSHSICAAPVISNWLRTTVERDAFFVEYPLVILQEFAGVRVDPELYDPDGDKSVSHFGALWRENISSVLHPDERAVPMTALLATESDGLPFIQHWVEEYGVQSWLEQLLRVVVMPLWHLLVHHGLAVEAHAQNAILVHRDGWPVRLALRDFHESFEYVPEFIGERENIPDFSRIDPAFAAAPAGKFYWMPTVDALRELYMDTLYIFHLSELAFICESHYGVPENRFWKMIDAHLSDYAAGGWCVPGRLRQIDHNASRICAESLVRRKLWDQPESEFHHWVENPFCKTIG